MTDGEADESVSRRGFLLGSAGVAAVSAAGATAAQDETTTSGEGGNQSEGGGNQSEGGNQSQGGGNQSQGGGGGGGGTEEVIVGPGGEFVFEPAELQIEPGTTVNFVWESDTHNIVVDSQPDGANWEGTPGSDSETYDTGYTYKHTFDTEGEYAYYCQPHRGSGMEGTITVGSGGGGGGEGSSVPTVPGSAKALGVATSGALAFTLGLAYFFIKFGGDYGEYGEYE